MHIIIRQKRRQEKENNRRLNTP